MVRLTFMLALCGGLGCEPVAVGAFQEPPADACPDDPMKTQPGGCGCGVPDDDFDADGALDCSEQCPDNAGQTEPVGACGCSDSTDVAACTELRAALRNLYPFDGTGTLVQDRVSAMDGSVLHAVESTPLAELERLQMNGRLNLDGFGSYVDLPDGLISSLSSATFEVWLAWRGGTYWSRILDFGNGSEDVDSEDQTYIFLTPSNATTRTMRAAYTLAGNAAETILDADVALPGSGSSGGGVPEHVALVIDAGQTMRMYLDGAEVSVEPVAIDLTQISDTNNWIGRSNFAVDPALFASLIEFRIYDRALTPAQINSSFRAGPGALD